MFEKEHGQSYSFKRLVHLLRLYTEQAQQGSDGLNVTCAAHFKDDPTK